MRLPMDQDGSGLGLVGKGRRTAGKKGIVKQRLFCYFYICADISQTRMLQLILHAKKGVPFVYSLFLLSYLNTFHSFSPNFEIAIQYPFNKQGPDRGFRTFFCIIRSLRTVFISVSQPRYGR